MKRKVILLFILILSTLTKAQQTTKKLIDTNEISHAEIVKIMPVNSQTKKLDKKQYTDLAQKWNSATALGADKYKMSYYVYIYTKSGQKRQFTVSANKIQENDWLTFDLKDKQYFDALWKLAK